MARLVEADAGVLALAHGGDYVANGTRWLQWQAWLTDHELTTTDDGRLLPIIPTRGNHEGWGPMFAMIFGAPPEHDHYYKTAIGRLRLWTLNTETSISGAQKAWLVDSLRTEAESGRAFWFVVQYHRAAFPAVKTPAAARMHWVPFFERFDVDLVFESDGHVLKRTAPIRGEQPDPSGVVYVGEGGLGVRQRTPDRSRWYLREGGMSAAADHVQVLAVSADQLEYRAVGADGELLDRMTRSRRRR